MEAHLGCLRMRYLKEKKIPKQFTIIYDDREKNPWQLPFEMKKKRLATGDYTISGYENVVAIEKKSGLIELLNDLSNGHRNMFERFLKRLSKYPIKCVVVEDTLSELNISRALMHVSKKSRGKARLTAKTIYYWAAEIAVKYQIPIVFVCKRAKTDLLPEVFRAAYAAANEL